MSTDPQDSTGTRRRSPGLILLGVAGLVVAGWGLTGGAQLPDPADLGWIAVVAGLVIGLILILTGARSSRR